MQELSLKKEHLLVKKTIVGLHVMKEVFRVFSPVCNQPEKIPVT